MVQRKTTDLEVKKFNPFANDIIFVDGLWGTGKSMLGPVISGMERVEKTKTEHVYEYVCMLRHLNKISPDAASWMLNNYADLSQYNNLIGREVNLRWRDDSGFGNNPNSIRYLRRLIGGEGDQKVSDISDHNLALAITSHMLMLVAAPIFEAYGDRAKIVEVVRHPLYMVQHWYSFLERFDAPRNFTLSLDYEGVKIPWFAAGWEEEFAQLNTMDRALLSIVKMYEWLDVALQTASDEGHSVLVLTFESLVLDPQESFQMLGSFLGRSHHPRLSRILRGQKIPRKTISEGKGHAGYGWSKGSNTSELEFYNRSLDFVGSKGSAAAVANFSDSIKWYNKTYPSVLAEYQ